MCQKSFETRNEQKVQKWPGRQLVVLIPKNYPFRVFFAIFSGTANELVVLGQPPNTLPRPHLMQKELTDFLNLPRRGTILDDQNVILYFKIDTVIQLFQWLKKWPLEQGLYKTLDPLFLHPIEPEISTWDKSAFCTQSRSKFELLYLGNKSKFWKTKISVFIASDYLHRY